MTVLLVCRFSSPPDFTAGLRWRCLRCRGSSCSSKKVVDVTGIEPATPLLANKVSQNTNSFVWCRLHVNQRNSRSPKCPEIVPKPASFKRKILTLLALLYWTAPGFVVGDGA